MNLMIVLNKDQVHQVVLIDKENSIILQTIKNMKKKNGQQKLMQTHNSVE